MGLLSNLFSASKYFTIIKPDFNFDDKINSDFDPDTGLLTAQITCEKINAEQLSKLPLGTFKSDDKKGKLKDKAHRYYDLLHSNPNNFQTSTLFVQQLERWRGHYGNSFAKIHPDGNGFADRFELVHPKQMKGYKITNGKLFFYREWEENGKRRSETLNNDQVLHFRGISEDGIFGLNPTYLLLAELENIHQGKTTLNNAYKNNLNVDKFFETTIQNFDSKTAKANISEVRKEYTGSVNTGKVPFLPAGFKLTPIQKSSFQDAQVLESIGFNKRDVAAFYGTPLHLLGIDGQSYNSIEQQTINFKTNTLQPIARMYRQEFEKKLLTPDDIANGVSIEFNLNAVVEVDMKTRTEYFKAHKAMGNISSNAIAKIEGFETYEGGDLHFIQSQNIPVEEYEKYAKAAQSNKQQRNEQDKDD